MNLVNNSTQILSDLIIGNFIFNDDDWKICTLYKFVLLIFQRFRSSETINTNLPNLSKRNIEWLTKKQLQGIPSTLLADSKKITQEQLKLFSPSQVMQFSSQQQAVYFTRCGLIGFADYENTILTNPNLYTPRLMEQLSVEQIQKIPATFFANMTNTLLLSFKPNSIRNFSPEQLNEFLATCTQRNLYKALINTGLKNTQLHPFLRDLDLCRVRPTHIDALYTTGVSKNDNKLSSAWSAAQLESLISRPNLFEKLADNCLFIQEVVQTESSFATLTKSQAQRLLQTKHLHRDNSKLLLLLEKADIQPSDFFTTEFINTMKKDALVAIPLDILTSLNQAQRDAYYTRLAKFQSILLVSC